ncbi:hypothetical protein AGR1B_Lc10009 [Agrobacterium fabacearum S56]|nr:hypothetical protein AGR1B_Lc10009 [Agrobacterium fabacearum S56]
MLADVVPNCAPIERKVVNAAIAETFVKMLVIEYPDLQSAPRIHQFASTKDFGYSR